MTTNGPARLLIVDDESINIEVLAEIFGDEYEIFFARDGGKALEIAAAAQPDVILLDVMMPGMDGYEVCRRLKAQDLTRAIPVIFVTALTDVNSEAKGLELGAVDYITKPVSPPVVKIRVKNQIELRRAQELLRGLATTDGLTGLANRRRFDEMLAHEYARHARTGEEISLIMIDIDHFKAFNDTYGHIAGDDCLRAVARAIVTSVSRAADLAVRYGGEEFVCLLPDTDHGGAVLLAEKIRAAISSLDIAHTHSSAADHVTASFGVVTAHCRAGGDPMGLVAAADEQLYAAKGSGRNRVCDITLEDNDGEKSG